MGPSCGAVDGADWRAWRGGAGRNGRGGSSVRGAGRGAWRGCRLTLSGDGCILELLLAEQETDDRRSRNLALRAQARGRRRVRLALPGAETGEVVGRGLVRDWRLSHNRGGGYLKMRIASIEAYNAAIEVSADDCARLAEACTLAAETISADGQRQEDVAYTEALGAAFRALGVAACAQWSMCHGAMQRMRETLQTMGL